jgi:leucine dehydrogenase
MPTVSFEHEQLVVRRGARSGLRCVVAIHSTTRGFACGGLRIWAYDTIWEAVDDALRLSRAMTYKNAAARLDHGGGKGVIALPPGERLEGERRRAALLDFGDLVESLTGGYGTAGDVGSNSEDMITVRERTAYAYCLPPEHGGGGDTSEPTAAGVELALEETCAAIDGDERLDGRSFAVIGLGQVGSRVARRLAGRGARLGVTDVDDERRELADELGADWLDPETALYSEVDVVVPCGMGRLLTPERVDRLRCKAITGAANNQLSEDHVAELLAARGILWAPDYIANAGGAIQAQLLDVDGRSPEEVAAHLHVIRENLHLIFERSAHRGTTPLVEADLLAESLI